MAKGFVFIIGMLVGATIANHSETRTEPRDEILPEYYEIICGHIWSAGAHDDDGDSPAREAIRKVCNL